LLQEEKKNISTTEAEEKGSNMFDKGHQPPKVNHKGSSKNTQARSLNKHYIKHATYLDQAINSYGSNTSQINGIGEILFLNIKLLGL